MQAIRNGIIYVSGINESGFLIDTDCLHIFPFYTYLNTSIFLFCFERGKN